MTAAELFEREQDDGVAETMALIPLYVRRNYERTCFHSDTAKARSSCGACAAKYENED